MTQQSHPRDSRSTVARWFSTERLVLWRVTAAVNLAVGAAGVVALTTFQPAPISVGAIPNGASVQRVTSPQPLPVSLAIPSIGVETSLEDLSVGSDGVLTVPEDYAKAGWWSSGPRPGADGAAVVVGHVDSLKGPAVFYRLRNLKEGDVIVVNRDNNTKATFVVDAIRQYDKATLPTRVVYGPTPTPSLRLITCGGAFDNKQRSYRDNIVVFAHLQTDKSVTA